MFALKEKLEGEWKIKCTTDTKRVKSADFMTQFNEVDSKGWRFEREPFEGIMDCVCSSAIMALGVV